MNNFDLLIPKPEAKTDSWLWATVTGINPLRIRLDGDDTSLSVTPDSLVKDLVVGNRVWVQLAGLRVIIHGASATQGAVSPTPTGTVQMFAGSTAPQGYLLCNGGTFSAAQYPALAAVVGSTYGTASGDTRYLPDFRGRSPLGPGTQSPLQQAGWNIVLGQKYGHVSTQTHTHVQNAHSHTAGDNGHAHTVNVGWNEQYGGHNWTFGVGTSNRNVNLFQDVSSYTGYASVYVNNATATNQNYGGGDSENIHPILGINFIIKT